MYTLWKYLEKNFGKNAQNIIATCNPRKEGDARLYPARGKHQRSREPQASPRGAYTAPMKHSLRSLIRFSIRDLLLVMVIVAVFAAWGIDHRRQAREIKELKEQQEQQLQRALERARSY